MFYYQFVKQRSKHLFVLVAVIVVVVLFARNDVRLSIEDGKGGSLPEPSPTRTASALSRAEDWALNGPTHDLPENPPPYIVTPGHSERRVDWEYAKNTRGLPQWTYDRHLGQEPEEKLKVWGEVSSVLSKEFGAIENRDYVYECFSFRNNVVAVAITEPELASKAADIKQKIMTATGLTEEDIQVAVPPECRIDQQGDF